jgi:hypothetical protein
MRKTPLTRKHPLTGLFLVLAPLILAFVPGFAQEGTVALPNDPNDMMLLATRNNGVRGDETQPWHLKFKFNVFDDQGSVSDTGTFEEFWAGPAKFKQVISSRILNHLRVPKSSHECFMPPGGFLRS